MKEDNTVDLQHFAKTIVLTELEKNGAISFMRAKIKKSVIDVIDNQKDSLKQKIEFDYMTPLHRLNKSKDIVIVCHLIMEFLSFYEMEYTKPIFENESNIKETIQPNSLLKELKLQECHNREEHKPILLTLIEDYQAKTKKLEGLIANQNNYGSSYCGGLSNYYNTKGNNNDNPFKSKAFNDDITNPVIPKKQLNPINFVNKSIEMNSIDDDNKQSSDSLKFNTFNLDSVYDKQINQESSSSQIKPKENLNTKMIQEPVIGGGFNEYMIDKEKNTNQYDNEFQEIILEDIIPLKNYNEDDNKKALGNSASNINSYGYDQSVSSYNLNEYDYIEEAEKPSIR